MLIGELSKRAGLSRDTIRYYEKLKLINIKERCAGNKYKNYGPEDLTRLRQIYQLKSVGFTLREIGQLLADYERSEPCKDLPLQLDQKLEKLDEQIATLQAFKSSLLKMKNACDGECDVIEDMPSCVPNTELI